MAASRAAQAQTARAAATTVVVMATSQAKLMQWKTGEEKDGKGFYWSTKLLVQQAWEQHNMSEDVHNYRTFKSAIHCLMVPIICAELLVSRAQFDAMPDAELIDKIDKRLKPTGPVDYLIRMRSIKMNHQSQDSLLHRYRAFAEPFLQLLSEATDAGCPINEESVKLAFKEQCKLNNLMMMWLQEHKWTGASNAHQHIMNSMKQFNMLSTLQSLNGGTGQAAPAPAVEQLPAQPAVPPMPYLLPPLAAPVPPAAFVVQPPAHLQQQNKPLYTKEQREAYNLQKRAAESYNRQSAITAAVHNAFQNYIPAPPAAAAAPQAPPQQLIQPVYSPMSPAYVSQQQQQSSASPANSNFVNNMLSTYPAIPHPGLDQRGENWHVHGPKCRFSPCASPFCQSCGDHGHTTATCRKRGKNANCNPHGYYSEQRPGQGPVAFDGIPRVQPIATTNSAPAPPSAFPTPHTLFGARPIPPPAAHNDAAPYIPVTRSNVAVQHSEQSHSAGAEPHQ